MIKLFYTISCNFFEENTMICRYRLGLDLGTSSLGWCCLDISNNEDRKILDMGVRIFPDGRTDKEKTPLCVSRREARGSRTRLRRFKMRQSKLIEDLQKIGLLPVDKNLFKDLEQANPYELRARAVKEKLSLFELGRVIFHLNQRRGFLNNRKEEKDAIKDEKLQSKKETKTQTAMNRLTDLMKSENCKTLGEFMFKTGKKRFKNPVDDKGKLQIDFYPNREMYIDEFEKIWNFQKQYYPNILTDEHKQIIENEDIFYQRNLKKQDAGYCSLEREEKRAPKAYVISQRFRIISELNNLKITYPSEGMLSEEERNKLLDFLDNPKEKFDNSIVKFERILELLNLPIETSFNLMENNREGIKYNETNAILGSDDSFGSQWFEFSQEQQNAIIDILQDYSLDDKEVLEKLKEICPKLSAEQINNILNNSLFLPDGYSNLSEKAMNKLYDEMFAKYDIAYEKAIENVYGKNIDELMSFEQFDFLPPYQELFPEQLKGGDKTLDKNLFYDDYMGRISNVSVHIALNQLRIIVNELIKKYEKPTEITIELGRDLTKGKKALADIAKRQRENAKIMDEARHAIRQQGVRITPFNIEKYKVWRNINPKNVLKRVDLYTGKTISLTDLFHGSYDIEHILPYSWTYDDSYDNKIITRSDVNRKKLNQLPYDFFTDESQLKSLAKNSEDLANMQLMEIKKRAKDIDKARGNIKKTFNFKSISWRFSEHAREIFNRNNKNMARDLGDMQYMSVLAKKYLTCICPKEKIISAKGIMTDLMKNVWNITDTLPRDYELWQVQKWQRDDLIEKKVRQITNENPDMEDSLIQEKAKEIVSAMSENEIQKQTSPKKDRSIHYHHALDAFTLANITTSIVQYVSSSKFANEVENFKNEKNENPDSKKQIDMKEAQLRLLKQSGKFYEKPYPSFNKEEFSKQLENIIVSYKNPVDKLKSVMKKSKILQKNMENFSFSSIHKAGAFGFREIVSIKNGDMEIKFAQKKDKKVKYDTKSLSCMIPIFRTKEQKRAFLEKYVEWQKACVRRKFITKEDYLQIEKEFIATFTKDKAFKWHESDGNYAAQIYQINKNDKFVPNRNENWSVEILSNYYAFERKGRFFWKDIYPTAKLITTLRINDIVEATFDKEDQLDKGFTQNKKWVNHQFELNPNVQQLQLLFRVKKMTGGSIYLRPLHIAQEDADKKSWICSVGKFKDYHCHKVCVTATGKVLNGN